MSAPILRDDIEARVLVEIAPPCDSRWHDKRGNGPAVWIVWLTPCGCGNRPVVGLACDPCLRAVLGYGAPCRCPHCGGITPATNSIVRRFEPINQRTRS